MNLRCCLGGLGRFEDRSLFRSKMVKVVDLQRKYESLSSF